MRAKYARLIRIGIMAQCIPTIRVGRYDHVDFERLRKYQLDYVRHASIPLVAEARKRTKKWESIRYAQPD